MCRIYLRNTIETTTQNGCSDTTVHTQPGLFYITVVKYTLAYTCTEQFAEDNYQYNGNDLTIPHTIYGANNTSYNRRAPARGEKQDKRNGHPHHVVCGNNYNHRATRFYIQKNIATFIAQSEFARERRGNNYTKNENMMPNYLI